MQKKTVTVLDIGSSGITAAVAESGLNNTIVIKGLARQSYSGFSDGEFFDKAETEGAVRGCLKQVCASARNLPDTVYVGVPGEFCKVVTRRYSISFQNKR